MTRTVELDTTPRLAGLFAKALLRNPRRKGAELPGLTLRQTGVRIDREALATYDDVCGFGLGDTVPATFVHLLAFPLQAAIMADAAFPFPLVGSVHLVNTITQHRPIDAGETLDLQVTATNLRPHFRGALVDLVAHASIDGDTVWEETSSYLFRGHTVPGEVPPRAPEPDLPTGPASRWRVGSDLGRRYAAVSGDVNPIHLHPLSAKALGFPTTIAHGMWSASRALAALANRVPDAFTLVTEFRAPVLLPSTVNFVAEQRGSGWQISLADARSGKLQMIGSISGTPATSIS